MVYGLIDRKNHRYYTHLRAVFEAINNAQNRYNWLITDCECYPHDNEISALFDREYCWLSGEELSALIEKEDFQWVWAVLSGFEKDVPLSEVLSHPLPSAENCAALSENPLSIQHPLAAVELVAWDSSWTVLISNDKHLVDTYAAAYPQCESLVKEKESIRLKIHGFKREWLRPFWVRFKKHYCPHCKELLTTTEATKVVNSKSEEAKNYDFSSVDTYMVGNIKFIWTEFLCPACGKTYSIQEIKENEKRAK